MHTRRELRRALQAFTEGLIEGHIATDIIITISGWAGPCVGSVITPARLQTARQCGARTKSGRPCRSPETKKGRCRLHGGASGSGGPSGERNGQYRHGERTKAAIAEQQKFSALLKMLRAAVEPLA